MSSPADTLRLYFNPQSQTQLTSIDSCNMTLRYLYTLCPHPLLLQTRLTSFAKVPILHSITAQTWPYALSSLSPISRPLFLKECMTSLSLLSPALILQYAYSCILSKTYKDAYDALSVQIHAPKYAGEKELHGILGFVSWMVFLEDGGFEYKEAARMHLGMYRGMTERVDSLVKLLGEIEDTLIGETMSQDVYHYKYFSFIVNIDYY